MRFVEDTMKNWACLVRGKEAMEMHGNTFQNVRKGIAKKETHTAVL